MIFPCMELFFLIFQVFHDFQSLWEPCLEWTAALSTRGTDQFIHDMGLNAREPVFGRLRTTKAQTSLSDQRLCNSLIGKFN